MTTTRSVRIEDINELIHKWPRVLVLARQEETQLTSEQLLQMFLSALARGVVFGVYGDTGLVGTACVVREGEFARILSIPSSQDGKYDYDKCAVDAIGEWADRNNLVGVLVTTYKLNGSSLSYFGNRLGFRRQSVTFIKEV